MKKTILMYAGATIASTLLAIGVRKGIQIYKQREEHNDYYEKENNFTKGETQ